MKLISISLIVSALLFFFIGCRYEKRIQIWSVFHSSTWNPTKDKISFARGYKIFKAPRGIARFPDGGISKSLHQSISFYVYDLRTGKLKMFHHIPDAPKSTRRLLWDIVMSWEGDVITYSLQISTWDKTAKSLVPVDWGTFSYDPGNGIRTKLEKPVTQKKAPSGRMAVPAGEITKMTRHCTVKEWGIDPLDYCRLSMREYIQDLMKLEGDQEYRNAILEKLAADITPPQAKKILDEFNRTMAQLEKSDHYRYLLYSFSIKEIRAQLEKQAGIKK